MKWSHKFVYTQGSNRPEDIITKSDGDFWLVLSRPVSIGSDQSWLQVSAGDAVRIPLLPYLTTNNDPSVAISYAFQLGATALLELDKSSIRHVHLSIGVPVEELEDVQGDRFRFYLGLAVKVRA